MADNPDTPAGTMKLISGPITYETEGSLVYSCDYLSVARLPGEAIVLQAFSTSPPILEGKGETVVPATRRCISQFQISFALARKVIKSLQDHLSEEEASK